MKWKYIILSFVLKLSDETRSATILPSPKISTSLHLGADQCEQEAVQTFEHIYISSERD